MKKNMVSIATCIVLYIVFPAHLGSPHFAIRHQVEYKFWILHNQLSNYHFSKISPKYGVWYDHVHSKLQPSHDMQLHKIGNHKYEFLIWVYTHTVKHNLVPNYPSSLNMVSCLILCPGLSPNDNWCKLSNLHINIICIFMNIDRIIIENI